MKLVLALSDLEDSGMVIAVATVIGASHATITNERIRLRLDREGTNA